jgi:hypothetical protein
MKLLKYLTTVLFLHCLGASPALAQSTQELQAQIKSMGACRQSLKHSDCDLQILDKDVRDLLVEIDQLNQKRKHQRPDNKGGIAQGRVQFFTDTISSVNDEVLKFTGGGLWKMDRWRSGLSFEDALGIMVDQKSAVIYVNGDSFSARLLDGMPNTSSGIIRTVVEEIDKGSVLRLDDGTRLEFSSYDQYDTGWWLPPYKVLIDLSSMNMWNLEKGKKVWIQRVR